MPPKSKGAGARDTINLQVLQRMGEHLARPHTSHMQPLTGLPAIHIHRTHTLHHTHPSSPDIPCSWQPLSLPCTHTHDNLVRIDSNNPMLTRFCTRPTSLSHSRQTATLSELKHRQRTPPCTNSPMARSADPQALRPLSLSARARASALPPSSSLVAAHQRPLSLSTRARASALPPSSSLVAAHQRAATVVRAEATLSRALLWCAFAGNPRLPVRDQARLFKANAHSRTLSYHSCVASTQDWKVQGVAGVFFLFARKKAPFWG
jgi:hypothetical protein